MKWGWQNSLFAWQPPAAGAGAFANPFAGTRRITLAISAGGPIGLEVVAGPTANVLTLEDRDAGIYSYLWGTAAHPMLSGQELIRWCTRVVRDGPLDSLQDLVGIFVLLIDDRRNGCVHMFGDSMGVRPWFTGRHKGRFVGGSSVWPIQQARLVEGRVNYDAVASWLYYGYDLTGGSLFADYRRLTPGAVVTVSAGEIREDPYVKITGGNARPPREQIADFVFEHVSHAFDRLTDGLPAATIALSGGYDSRLLVALASRKKGLKSEVFVVGDNEVEAQIASRVTATTGMPLQILRTDGSMWNMFDEPFHALPEGFPITKQLVYTIAARRPGVPMLNGFMGDMVTRGTGLRSDRDLEFQPEETLVPFLTRRRRLVGVRFDLLDPTFARRVEERASDGTRTLVRNARGCGKPFVFSGLYGRQRCYTANNVIQHIDISEALTPFYTWPLIDSRLRNDVDCFWWETYEVLFQRHFPELASIPHGARLGIPPRRKLRASRNTPRWALGLLTNLLRNDFLPMLSRRKAVSRLTGALVGRVDVEAAVLFLQRMFLLEERLRRMGVEFNWREI